MVGTVLFLIVAWHEERVFFSFTLARATDRPTDRSRSAATCAAARTCLCTPAPRGVHGGYNSGRRWYSTKEWFGGHVLGLEKWLFCCAITLGFRRGVLENGCFAGVVLVRVAQALGTD